MSLKITSKWAKKKTTKPPTVNKKLLAAPVRYCKYCQQEIPKVHGLSVKTYSIKEFCSREHYMLYHHKQVMCIDCGVEFWTSITNPLKYCPSCTKKSQALTAAYKKKCSNPNCTHLIQFVTEIRFGRQKYCSLHCFMEHMGGKVKLCSKCNNPLFSNNGDYNEYNNKKRHNDCQKAIFFLKKLEEKSKWNYINYKEVPIHDTIDPDSD
jgi:hypothetical protein